MLFCYKAKKCIKMKKDIKIKDIPHTIYHRYIALYDLYLNKKLFKINKA